MEGKYMGYSLVSDFSQMIKKGCMNTNKIMICSPFISENPMFDFIQKKEIDLRIIFRLCLQTPTDFLKQLYKAYPDCIHFFEEEDNFHSKIYIMDKNVIVGSSNFTFGGLCKNKELNICVPFEDNAYNEIVEQFEHYWEESEPLTQEIVDCFIKTKNEGWGETNKSIISLTDKIQKELTECRQFVLTQEGREKRIQAVKKSLAKPVVCLNTKKEYQSILQAADEHYNYRRCYGYISKVCKHEKKDYKGDIWRFKSEFENMPEYEINKLIVAAKRETMKEKEKYLFDNQYFSKRSNLLDAFKEKYNYSITRSELYRKIKEAEERNQNVCKIEIDDKVYYLYFAKYYQLIGKQGEIEEEVEVEKTLEEYKEYYKLLMQLEFGDFKGCDVVVSDKDEYYKIDGQYYKNRNSLKEYNDAIICRDEAIYRLKSGEYSLGNDISMQFLEKTNKKELYVKNKLIYKNKKGYVDEHISTVTRDEILLEIQMLIE